MDVKNQSGQIGLVVLLIGAVLMTLGIGVATQSVLETKSAGQETDFSQVFNTAEQGVEEALRDIDTKPLDTPVSFSGPNGFSGTYEISEVKKFESLVAEGDSIQINLANHTGPNKHVYLRWKDDGKCQNAEGAAIVVTWFNGSTVRREAWARPCARTDGMRTASCSEANHCRLDYHAGSTPVLPPAEFVRVKVLYSSTTLEVWGDASFPVQSRKVLSTASLENNETATVEVVKPLPATPSIFDYALFSGNGSIQHN